MKPRGSNSWSSTPSPLLVRVGADLRRARLAAMLSQRQLGRMTGVDQATISRLERGLAGGMAVARLARLIAVIGWPDSGPREQAVSRGRE